MHAALQEPRLAVDLDGGVVALHLDHLDAVPGLADFDCLRVAAVEREDRRLVADNADHLHVGRRRRQAGEGECQ
jgi:hypothetical protein